MKSSAKNSWRGIKNIWIALLLILVVITGAGCAYPNQATTAQAQPTSPSLTTKNVRTGGITLATSGSVTLVASRETALAFTVSGTVAELNVAVGDAVKEGQVLAQLDNLDDLKAAIKSAEQDLSSAEQDLAVFKAKAPANLANAQLAVIEAQEALADAQSSVVQKDWARCDQDTRDKLLTNYNKAVANLESLGDGGGNADYYLNTILPQKKVVDQALGAYQSCAGYTDYQVASSQVNLTAAEAKLQQAQHNLDVLSQNEGLDPSGLATAENAVATAQLALDDATNALEGAVLTAPFDGTVLSVEGTAGDTIVVTDKITLVDFITIADLVHPILEFTVDETDLSMVAVGEAASVTFDAFPDRKFTGSVTRIDPTVGGSSSSESGASEFSSSSSSGITGLVELDLSQETDIPAFPKNLSGSVEIVQASVQDVLLIPVEALHEQSDGSYSVYVLGADGQPVMKTVEIGLMDVASVEIKRGLSASDVVVTSAIQ